MIHTPAPWKVIETWRFDHAGNQRDALVIVNDDSNADVLSGTNAEANARLIAAAPELLAALKSIFQLYVTPREACTYEHWNIAWGEVSQAIAKAEGDNNG